MSLVQHYPFTGLTPSPLVLVDAQDTADTISVASQRGNCHWKIATRLLLRATPIVSHFQFLSFRQQFVGGGGFILFNKFQNWSICSANLWSKNFYLGFFIVESDYGVDLSCSTSKDLERTLCSFGISKERLKWWISSEILQNYKTISNIISHLLWAYGTPLSHDLDKTKSKMLPNITLILWFQWQPHFVASRWHHHIIVPTKVRCWLNWIEFFNVVCETVIIAA